MLFFRSSALFIILGLGVASCATSPGFSCPDTNWRVAGFADGQAGQSRDYIDSYAAQCPSYTGQEAKMAWLAGLRDGEAVASALAVYRKKAKPWLTYDDRLDGKKTRLRSAEGLSTDPTQSFRVQDRQAERAKELEADIEKMEANKESYRLAYEEARQEMQSILEAYEDQYPDVPWPALD